MSSFAISPHTRCTQSQFLSTDLRAVLMTDQEYAWLTVGDLCSACDEQSFDVGHTGNVDNCDSVWLVSITAGEGNIVCLSLSHLLDARNLLQLLLLFAPRMEIRFVDAVELMLSCSVPTCLSIFDDRQLFRSCIGLMSLAHCRIHAVESLPNTCYGSSVLFYRWLNEQLTRLRKTRR